MTYSLPSRSGLSGVVCDADGACVPADPGNVDWQAYQAWLAAGNAPTPAPSPPAPVPSCALWQLQAVMTPAQWMAVQSAVAALANPAVSAFFAHGTNVIPAELDDAAFARRFNRPRRGASDGAGQPGRGGFDPVKEGE